MAGQTFYTPCLHAEQSPFLLFTCSYYSLLLQRCEGIMGFE